MGNLAALNVHKIIRVCNSPNMQLFRYVVFKLNPIYHIYPFFPSKVNKVKIGIERIGVKYMLCTFVLVHINNPPLSTIPLILSCSIAKASQVNLNCTAAHLQHSTPSTTHHHPIHLICCFTSSPSFGPFNHNQLTLFNPLGR